MPPGLDNLRHIVVLMMENRSFDHMLGFSGISGIDAVSGAAAPHRTRKISQPVRGQQCRSLERRNKKRTGQMRLMMLDTMNLRPNRFRAAIERRR